MAKFYGISNGNSLKERCLKERCLDYKMSPNINKRKISAWKKVDRHLVAKTDGKLNDNSREAQERCLDPEVDLNCPKYGRKSKIYNLSYERS